MLSSTAISTFDACEQSFSAKVLAWSQHHGRKSLPWQQELSPYRVWISEIMLQQTQVATVISYFNRFMERFSTIKALAASPIDDVLALWSGLGYYTRARNLHKAAQIIVQQHQGQLPHSVAQLVALPGIGRSTAGAIASISMNIRAPILDGNVKRVLTRHFAIEGWPGKRSIEQLLWKLAHTLLPKNKCGHYTQALMDLGATICTRSKPKCSDCPLKTSCIALSMHTQLRYPTPKPKKVLPTRKTYMLLLVNAANQVLLKKKPAKGVWGGLWSLPEFDNIDRLSNVTGPLTSIDVQQTKQWSTFRHTFSHYHLDIMPIQAFTSKVIPFSKGENKQWCWYTHEQQQTVGLPAPVKKLLSQLESINS